MKIPKAQIAEARANLLAAPAKEDAGSVRAAVLQMRGELMAALIEKNWSFAELRDWLATQGIEVSLAALQRYLVGVRAARKVILAQSADRAPKPESGVRETPAVPTSTAGQGSAQANPARAIPPMPRPVPPMPGPSVSAGPIAKTPDPSFPRASSFPVRRDRENL
jgi:hypothetical protein